MYPATCIPQPVTFIFALLMKYIFLLFIAMVLVSSCYNEGDCLITSTNNMYIHFSKRSNHAIDSALFIDTVFVSGSDTVQIYNSSLTVLLLPVDINHDTTMFVIKHTNSTKTVFASDTLKVAYIRQSKVITKACGAYTFFNGLKMVKTNLEDSQIKPYSTSLIYDPTSSAYALNYQIFY